MFNESVYVSGEAKRNEPISRLTPAKTMPFRRTEAYFHGFQIAN
jgi:hypothetical protein